MDARPAAEAIEAIINTVPPDEHAELFEVLRANHPDGLGSLVVGESAEIITSKTPEIAPLPLTPEEAAFKESLLERLESTYRTYASGMNVINGARGKKEAKLPVADFLVVKAAAEGFLTDNLVRGAKAEVDKFTANPIENSPAAGFNLLPLPNTDLTGDDETALTDHVQSLFSRAYQGKPRLYSLFHNDDTAHRADGTAADVTFVLAPTHLNLDTGTAAKQKTDLEAHNADPEATTTYQTGSDVAALLHIKHLADNKLIDTTTKGYEEDRLWQTYYRDIQAKPDGGIAPSVCVGGYARVYRVGSYVDPDRASRALVVPKA